MKLLLINYLMTKMSMFRFILLINHNYRKISIDEIFCFWKYERLKNIEEQLFEWYYLYLQDEKWS